MKATWCSAHRTHCLSAGVPSGDPGSVDGGRAELPDAKDLSCEGVGDGAPVDVLGFDADGVVADADDGVAERRVMWESFSVTACPRTPRS
jgi:hypothetical protein